MTSKCDARGEAADELRTEQYKPDVPCQYQGASMGGGAYISVALVKPEPAAKKP